MPDGFHLLCLVFLSQETIRFCEGTASEGEPLCLLSRRLGERTGSLDLPHSSFTPRPHQILIQFL